MKTKADARRVLQKKMAGKTDSAYLQPGNLGDETGLVDVPDQDGQVFVSLQDAVIQCYADPGIPRVPGIPVMVGFSLEQPNLLQVLAVRSGGMGIYLGQNQIGNHHIQHEWPRADTVYISDRQILPLRLVVLPPWEVSVYPGWVWISNTLTPISLETPFDLSSKVPATAGKARLIVFAIDDAGTVVEIDGDLVDMSALNETSMPVIPLGVQYILGAVRLFYKQNQITEAFTEEDVLDLRFPIWHKHGESTPTGGGGSTPLGPGAGYSPGPHVWKISDDGDGILGANAAGWHHASVASIIRGTKTWEVYAFWNSETFLTFAIRTIPGPFKIYATTIPYNTSTGDAHNGIAVGLDVNGFIHVSYDNHDSALKYRRSTLPIESFTGTLTAALSMLGSNENSVTYPGFLNDASMNLYFTFRNGDSNLGNQYFYKYNDISHAWVAAPGTGTGGLLIDGIDDHFSLYITTPSFDAGTFSDGAKMHLFWAWKHWPSDGNGYTALAYTSWNGSSFKKSDGSAQTVPIRQSNYEEVDDLGNTVIQPSCLNQSTYSDSAGHPHLIFTRDALDGNLNYYHYWHDGTSWIKTRLAEIPSSDTYHNAGMPIMTIDRSVDVVYIAYTNWGEGNGYLYYLASDPGDFTTWSKGILYPHETDSSHLTLYQPKVDVNEWERSHRWMIPIELNAASSSTPLPIYWMEYTPSGWGLANAKEYPGLHANDVDQASSSIHHTLGSGADQAAAGNHTHANLGRIEILQDSQGAILTDETGAILYTEVS